MRTLLIVLLGTIVLCAHASAYEVRDGEHLGHILKSQGYSPLWGNQGFVKKTLELNPKKIRNEGNFLQRNAIIHLPKGPVKSTPKNQLQQTIEVRHSAPQVIHRKQEHLSVSASLSTRAMYMGSKDKTTGKKENLRNDPSPGLTASVDHLFVDNWTAGFFVSSHRLDFKKPEGKHLERGTRSFNEFGLTGVRFLSDTRSLLATVSLEERPFLYDEGNKLVLDRVTLPKFTLSYSTELLENKRFILHSSIGMGTLLPVWKENYYVNQGISIFTGIMGRYKLSEKWYVSSAFTAEYSQQNSSKSENQYTDVGFQLGVSFITDSPNL